jgi:putative membrane protein
VNATLGTIMALFTAPLVLLPLGLFTLVINAAMFELVDWLSAALTIDGFWWSVLAATLVTAFTAVFTLVLHLRRDAGRRRLRGAHGTAA